jgi:multidrug efflux pump subunit AcrB
VAKYFIHHPVARHPSWSLLILITGGLGIGTLPVAQYPQISPPTVEVEINYPGANAETLNSPSQPTSRRK